MEKWATFFNRVLEGIRDIPIEDIVGNEIQLVRRGRYYMGLCPFHPDTKLGSFFVTPDLGIYKCFACGASGNGINFIMRYRDLNYVDACLYIAKRHGIITDAEFNSHFDKELKMPATSVTALKKEGKSNVGIKADSDVINYVYSAMPRVFPLKDEHLNHLLNVRNLTDTSDYFSMVNGKADIEKLILDDVARQLIKEAGLTEEEYKVLKQEKSIKAALLDRKYARVKEQLQYVPGFFRLSDTKALCYSANSGIGFLVKDDLGKALGIQIRRDEEPDIDDDIHVNIKKLPKEVTVNDLILGCNGEYYTSKRELQKIATENCNPVTIYDMDGNRITVKEKLSRYIWFASTFAIGSDHFEGGASPGAPGGVIFPKNMDGKPEICITEGRFKAEKIASLGKIAIYVSGVSSWKSIMPIVSNIDDRGKVFLMFDSDMLGNPAVHTQLASLAAALAKENIKTNVIVWSKSNGKGFDDLVNNEGLVGVKNYLKNFSFDKFEPIYQGVLEEELAEYGVSSVTKLPKASVEKFGDDLQNRMEEKLGLKK